MRNRPVADIIATAKPAPANASALCSALGKSLNERCMCTLPSLILSKIVGLADRFGSISAGRAADLVIADDDLNIRAVMVAGKWFTRLTAHT